MQLWVRSWAVQLGLILRANSVAAVPLGVKYRDEHVCQVVTQTHQEEQFAGYNVRYVYAGATYNTVMPQDPGQTMRVRVHVRPAQ